jgi:hypothetical protein
VKNKRENRQISHDVTHCFTLGSPASSSTLTLPGSSSKELSEIIILPQPVEMGKTANVDLVIFFSRHGSSTISRKPIVNELCWTANLVSRYRGCLVWCDFLFCAAADILYVYFLVSSEEIAAKVKAEPTNGCDLSCRIAVGATL